MCLGRDTGKFSKEQFKIEPESGLHLKIELPIISNSISSRQSLWFLKVLQLFGARADCAFARLAICRLGPRTRESLWEISANQDEYHFWIEILSHCQRFIVAYLQSRSILSVSTRSGQISPEPTDLKRFSSIRVLPASSCPWRRQSANTGSTIAGAGGAISLSSVLGCNARPMFILRSVPRPQHTAFALY